MGSSNTGTSPLEAAAGTAGPRVAETFELLSNETRLAILLALWEEYDPFAEDTAVPFSVLYDRISMRDSGNFTYHLDKLSGHFVEETDDGYRLREAGLSIVQAVLAGAGLDNRTLEPSEIDSSCYRCGELAELTYEDEHIYLRCTKCEGGLSPEFLEELPARTLARWDFNPAGLAHRTPEEIFAAAKIESLGALWVSIRGICPQCSGSIDESVQVCESHETTPGEVCPNCGTKDEL